MAQSPAGWPSESDIMLTMLKKSGLLCLLCICICAMVPEATGGQALDTPPGHETCLASGTILKDRMRNIFRTQLAGGGLNVSGTDAWLEDFPLLSTLCLKSHSIDADREFLQLAYTSIARYYNYLFIEKDTDGDFLIESADWELDGRPHERVAFNALLVLDMENLSRICLQLGVPLRGLFWHDGTLLIRERLIDTCYDPDANSFFSVEPVTHFKRHGDGYLSLLPTLFPSGLGENFAASMIRQYISHLSEPLIGGGASDPDSTVPLMSALIADQLKLLLLPEILERNGMFTESVTMRSKLDLAWSKTDLKAPQGETYSDFLNCIAGQDELRRCYPALPALELFEAIVTFKQILKTEDAAELRESIEIISGFLTQFRETMIQSRPVSETFDGRTALAAIRRIDQSVSAIKHKQKRGAIFTARDRSDIPGFDFDGALTRLIDDVVQSLGRLETKVFKIQGFKSGFQVTGHLLKERAVVGQTITIRLAFSVNRSGESIRSIVLSRQSRVDTLMSRQVPVDMKPGAEPLVVQHQFAVPSSWSPGIMPLDFKLDIRMGSGERRRMHFFKSLYIDAPVTYRVDFPDGRVLQDWGVPLHIQLTKKAPYPVVIQTGWYSPSGLQLKEGRSQEIHMPENLDLATIQLHVLAPSPIRPGAFPFTLKLFANGLDIGTLSSEFFKHYQWVFVGPFPTGDRPLAQSYPPEHHVNLLDGFDGIGCRIFWRMLPPEALVDNGDIQIGSLLAPEGIGYLYTVIKSTRAMSCPAYLSSSVPCALYINNRLVLSPGKPSAYPAQTTVHLNEGLNNILIKIAGSVGARVFFNLGENDNLSSDEFNNNLWELVDGYKDFYETRIQQFAESSSTQKIATIRFFDQEANSVSVIGTFNGWSPENSQLRKMGDGMWEISLHLAPGKYAYRFLVNNNTQSLDPRCPVQEPDGYGGRNSVMYIE